MNKTGGLAFLESCYWIVISVLAIGITASSFADAATRLVFQDEYVSEEQSNSTIGTGDASFGRQDYGKAMQSYLSASADIDPVVRGGALNRIGILYERALGVPQDYRNALDYFRKAAALGNGFAEANIGDFYFYGLGLASDITEALKWYQKAADHNVPLGLNQTGWAYLQGRGRQKDTTEAMKRYRRSAELGSPNAAYEVGWIYGHVEPVDYGEAMSWYQKAASHHHVEAQNNIGTLYEKGHGVAQDFAKAFYWYQAASKAGYARAQFHLGELYFTGHGVKQDTTAARELMQTAAGGGDADAQMWLQLHN
jgi:TPR repeat protein